MMASPAKRTRSATSHVIFGYPSEFVGNVLPTRLDCCCRVLSLREERLRSGEVKRSRQINFVMSEIYFQVATEVIAIWQRASLKTSNADAVAKNIRKWYEQGVKFSHMSDAVRSKNKRFKEYEPSLQKLLDICTCKCKAFHLPDCGENCSMIHHRDSCKLDCDYIHLNCNCRTNKVPEREVRFLLSQRGNRDPHNLLVISQIVDKNASKEAKRKDERKHKTDKWLKKQPGKEPESVPSTSYQTGISSSSGSDMIDTESSDTEFQPYPQVKTQPMQVNTTPLPTLAQVCDRYGLSNRAGAAAATATLIDFHIVSKEDKTAIIDHHKLARERRRHRQQVQQEEKSEWDENVSSIYFDGKRDATLSQHRVGNKIYPTSVIEDHYVIIAEPGGHYLHHVTPKSGHGVNIAKAIYKFLLSNSLQDKIMVVGGDGCNANVGWQAGAIHYLEMFLGRPLQWQICMLHGNELPFRALFTMYDGRTSGPQSFSGQLGRKLKKQLCTQEVVDFRAIPASHFPVLPDEIMEDLSWDQNLLYRLCQAVITGNMEEDLALLEPGPLSHSRWLTLAQRILSLYVRTKHPNTALRRLASIVVKFYAPCWFTIKHHSLCTDGPRNLFLMINLLTHLNGKEKQVAKKAIQRNAFYAHPENLLLTMLSDDEPKIRKVAIDHIMDIRNAVGSESTSSANTGQEREEENLDDVDIEGYSDDEASGNEVEDDEFPQDPSIRPFKVPMLQFHATSYDKMIDWNKELLTEPPLIKKKSNEEVHQIEVQPLVVPKYPCHTQSVERAVKVVSEASQAVYGIDQRDGFIRQRLYSRLRMKTFSSKQDFEAYL